MLLLPPISFPGCNAYYTKPALFLQGRNGTSIVLFCGNSIFAAVFFSFLS